MSRKFRILLAIFLCFAACFVFVSCDDPPASDGDGETAGTAGDVTEDNQQGEIGNAGNENQSGGTEYIQISTAQQLLGIVNDADGKYTLTQNIDFDGRNIEPLFDEENPFEGEINGGGYSVSGFTMTGDAENIGLLGYVGDNGKITDVAFNDFRINVTVEEKKVQQDNAPSIMPGVAAGSGTSPIQTKTNIGAVAGTVNGALNNITVTGEINITARENVYIGGVAGVANGNIANCRSFVDISLERDTPAVPALTAYVGGVVGRNDYLLGACDYSGAITTTNIKAYAGGIVGFANMDGLTMSRLYANAEISADYGSVIGGLVGALRAALVQSYSEGMLITYGYGMTAGGIAGIIGVATPDNTGAGACSFVSSADINNCYSLCVIDAREDSTPDDDESTDDFIPPSWASQPKNYFGGIVGSGNGIVANSMYVYFVPTDGSMVITNPFGSNISSENCYVVMYGDGAYYADKLNEGQEGEIWKNNKDSFPTLTIFG